MEKTARNNPEQVVYPFYAVIVAGGRGTRFSEETPKLYEQYAGKAVLRHSVEPFLQCPGLVALKVIIHPDHVDLYRSAFDGLGLPDYIFGGGDRKSSVFNGIVSFGDIKDKDCLLIHDGARPFVTRDEIECVVRETYANKAATLVTPVFDTIKRESGEYIDRTGLWAVQTPQGFRYDLIRNAHENVDHENHTDDTGLVQAQGHDVSFVEGGRMNIKITTRKDLEMAEMLAQAVMKTETRTGSGFDVHAFDSTQSGPVRLCGVDIEHENTLAGHSDADVGLHALTDALLGAMAEGDIGKHFPPSDDQWKGKDSVFFLEHALNMLRKRGGRIVNLDVTLICEQPKIGPHMDDLRQRVADICATDISRISIKATTTEKLGFTGREEGIAAQAVINIELPAVMNAK